jgi:hypothetical protein
MRRPPPGLFSVQLLEEVPSAMSDRALQWVIEHDVGLRGAPRYDGGGVSATGLAAAELERMVLRA